MSDLARREAALEALNNNLERKVERRTREMSEKFEALFEIPIPQAVGVVDETGDHSRWMVEQRKERDITRAT